MKKLVLSMFVLSLVCVGCGEPAKPSAGTGAKPGTSAPSTAKPADTTKKPS
jgi:hypothetical protein